MTDRQLLAPAFPDDTGAVDPAVGAALEAYGAGTARYVDALAALQHSRVLVPVVAVLGEVEVDEAGLAHDKSSDMAAVLMTGADGRLALLGFTGTERLTAWDPQARPVPVTMQAATAAAVQEDAAALVLDLVGPVTFVIEGDDLRALASGWTLARIGDEIAWVAPAEDPDARG
ncbi:hypothetical protein BH11ACT8_BH11ACT8_24520 [soil metagenome]